MPFRTYVISLVNALDRREQCVAQLKSAGMEYVFFDAVDGRNLSADEISESYDADLNEKLFKRPLSLPEIGCYLSHYELWKKIASGDDRAVLVLEDDFMFSSRSGFALEMLSKYDLADVYLKLDCDRMPKKRSSFFKFDDEFYLTQPEDVPAFTTGYILGKQAALKLLEARRRFFRPVDIDLKHLWEHNVPLLVLHPSLVKSRDITASASSIEAGRKQIKTKSSLRRFVRNVDYQFNLKSGIHRHKPVDWLDKIRERVREAE